MHPYILAAIIILTCIGVLIWALWAVYTTEVINPVNEEQNGATVKTTKTTYPTERLEECDWYKHIAKEVRLLKHKN